jgi:hypothetical protein
MGEWWTDLVEHVEREVGVVGRLVGLTDSHICYPARGTSAFFINIDKENKRGAKREIVEGNKQACIAPGHLLVTMSTWGGGGGRCVSGRTVFRAATTKTKYFVAPYVHPRSISCASPFQHGEQPSRGTDCTDHPVFGFVSYLFVRGEENFTKPTGGIRRHFATSSY